jgi:quercetin dioxygenase-like cupin family protein
MEYKTVETEDVPITDLSEVDGVPPDLDTRDVASALGAQQMRLGLWYFEPGEEIQYHAHAEQEEVYYAVEGEFSLKLGRSGEEEYTEVGPGTFWIARPKIGHGHRYVGDDQGVVLAIGAPPVSDPGIDPHSMEVSEEYDTGDGE